MAKTIESINPNRPSTLELEPSVTLPSSEVVSSVESTAKRSATLYDRSLDVTMAAASTLALPCAFASCMSNRIDLAVSTGLTYIVIAAIWGDSSAKRGM